MIFVATTEYVGDAITSNLHRFREATAWYVAGNFLHIVKGMNIRPPHDLLASFPTALVRAVWVEGASTVEVSQKPLPTTLIPGPSPIQPLD